LDGLGRPDWSWFAQRHNFGGEMQLHPELIAHKTLKREYVSTLLGSRV